MLQTRTCEFINEYSEIEGFQKRRTMTYSAEVIPEGVYISVKQEIGSDIHTVACVCTDAAFDYITSFLRYICENSVGLGVWYNILQETDIHYTVA